MYEYGCDITRIIDGDTVVGDWDLGDNLIKRETHFRVRGIDAIERSVDAMRWLEAKRVAGELLRGKTVEIKTNKPPFGYEVKTFERYVVDITVNGMDFATMMLDNGLAVVWHYKHGDPHPPQ